jgi:hypothetical protein
LHASDGKRCGRRRGAGHRRCNPNPIRPWLGDGEKGDERCRAAEVVDVEEEGRRRPGTGRERRTAAGSEDGCGGGDGDL